MAKKIKVDVEKSESSIKVSPTDVAANLTEREKRIVSASKYEDTKDLLFKEKYPYLKYMDFFKRSLFSISTIHEFGARKYSYYSHMNVPHLSFNTIDDGIEAVRRHFTLYRTGNFIDESGIYHVAHLCCRAGSMLLTRFYRLYMKRYKVMTAYRRDDVQKFMTNIPFDPHYTDEFPVYWDQITPEVKISMIKFKPEYIPESPYTCVDLIDECLWALETEKMISRWDPYNEVSHVDLLMWCAAKLVNNYDEVDDQCISYLKKID